MNRIRLVVSVQDGRALTALASCRRAPNRRSAAVRLPRLRAFWTTLTGLHAYTSRAWAHRILVLHTVGRR